MVKHRVARRLSLRRRVATRRHSASFKRIIRGRSEESPNSKRSCSRSGRNYPCQPSLGSPGLLHPSGVETEKMLPLRIILRPLCRPARTNRYERVMLSGNTACPFAPDTRLCRTRNWGRRSPELFKTLSGNPACPFAPDKPCFRTKNCGARPEP